MDHLGVNEYLIAVRSTIEGEFVSASRVVDVLLDLRLLAIEHPALVELIDTALASIAGRSIATNSWWIDQLDAMERIADTVGEQCHPAAT